MSCRATGCDDREWMARKFCQRHWKMLPVDLQIRVRKLLGGRRWNPDMSEFGVLVDEANAIITAVEKEQHENAHVMLYRTRMAAVTGLVMNIRQLPFPQMRIQLLGSIDELLANNLDLYRERRVGIERDLAFLEFFIETRERLGALIQTFPVSPAPVEEDTVEIHTSDPLGGIE
jgi:hypothetical protein